MGPSSYTALSAPGSVRRLCVQSLARLRTAEESGNTFVMDLYNDTVTNVAGLLKEQVGSSRQYEFHLDRFPMDDGADASEIDGAVKLRRLRLGIIADVRARGTVEIACVRCLQPYDQSFATEFSEEFRQTVDVRTGVGVGDPEREDDDTSVIDENHELDLANVLRQEIVVALPMRPDCGERCPGPESLLGERETTDMVVDERLAALGRLLDD